VWLVVIVTLTLATLRLPLIYTAVFALVDLALLLSLLGLTQGSAGVSKAGGYAELAFAALGVYLFASTASVATGGRPLPLGRPLVH
jgi:succinate-acetate transporter protein